MPIVVHDQEVLYRSIRITDVPSRPLGNGFVISASAFNDAERKPSVDLASLRPNPADSKLSPTDGIAKLVAHQIRAIELLHHGTKPPTQYAVDVLHRPIERDNPRGEPENEAHAQIETSPPIARGPFDRLKESLARLAAAHGWVIAPT